MSTPRQTPIPTATDPYLPTRPTGPELMVPRGAVKVLGRLLVMSHGDPAEAAALARRWAGSNGDARYDLLAGILDEIAADCADLLKAGATPA